MFWNKKAVEPKYTLQLILNDADGVWTVEYVDDDHFAIAALEVLRTRSAAGKFYPTREELDNDLAVALKRLDVRYGKDKPESLPEKADGDDEILTLSNLFQRRSAEAALREAYAKDLEFVADLEGLLEETKDTTLPLTDWQKEMAVYLLDLRTEFPGEDYEIRDISDPGAIWNRASENDANYENVEIEAKV